MKRGNGLHGHVRDWFFKNMTISLGSVAPNIWWYCHRSGVNYTRLNSDSTLRLSNSVSSRQSTIKEKSDVNQK